MAGPEILRKIVVKISSDKRNLKGTGFFVSEREILTCHHVLADGNGRISEGQKYFVKNDDWEDWIEAQPIRDKCSAAQDFAFLSCPVPIGLEAKRVPFKRWNGRHKEFFTRGYDCNTSQDEGASSLEGEDCRIVDSTTRGKWKRWQLSTIKKSLLPGRSGSPVWSVRQRAIVGMIDYRAGDENELKEKSLAIPIEEIFRDLPPAKSQPINVPSLPPDFLPRPKDLMRLKDLVLSPGEGKSAITGKTAEGCPLLDARVGLQGMGGIGKSVLAAALAWDDQVLEAFPDGVIWISLGQNPDLATRQLQLLRFLDEAHRAISDVQDGLGCLRQMLHDVSCLIILDDVWSVESVRAFDALGQDCRMLVTTRDREIVRGMKARELCLDVLDQVKSIQLLALSSGIKLEDLGPKAREVAEECDRLPLALAMVGSMARAALDRGRVDPWEHILHRLRTADLDKIKAEFPGYPYPNLLRAIEVSVESLEPEEQRNYLYLAVFPEDEPIPESVLGLLWGLDEWDTRELADLLADLSLARFNSDHLGLHHLQRDFAVKSGNDLQRAQTEYERTSMSGLSGGLLHDLQRDLAGKRAGGLLALHNRLVEAYKVRCPDGWHTGPDDGYFFKHLAYHLLQSGRKEELKKLLLDLRWLETRLEKTDITSLISDYDLLPEDEELVLLQHGLRLSSHVLSRDSKELNGQLLGRMQSIDLPGIRELMQQAGAGEGRPWLRPISSSLNSPGEPLDQNSGGPSGGVNAVALTSDGRRAVSVSYATLKVWDLKSGRAIRTLEGHSGGVNAIALTSDGRRAVSALNNGTLKVWDLESGQEIQVLQGHTEPVRVVGVTSDNKIAISGSNYNDGNDDNLTLKVWDLKSGREIETLQKRTLRITAVAVTPDCNRVVLGSHEDDEDTDAGYFTINDDDENYDDSFYIQVWDLERNRVLTLQGHTFVITAVAVTSDGCRAISGSHDTTLKVWDIENGSSIMTLEGHTDGVCAVALTSDGRWAASASFDRTIKVWDLESGKMIASFTGDSSMLSCAVSPDGQTIVAGEASGRVHFLRLEGLPAGKDAKPQS